MSETNSYPGKHYELIKSRINPVFANMALHRTEALRNVKPQRAQWMRPDDPDLRKALADHNIKAWEAQNSVDGMLASLKDARTFAESLLRDKLKTQYNLDIDVKRTYARLYVKDFWGGIRSRTVSLLDAALHNFANNETVEKDSAFLTPVDSARGLYGILNFDTLITLEQFKQLCRELDIGARYRKHLEDVLLIREPFARTYLKNRIQNNQKAAMMAAAQVALATGQITQDAHALLRALHDGHTNLTLCGQPMQVFGLSMLGARLTGIVFIAPAPGKTQISQTVIVYVPHDPRHPLKQYRNSTVFRDELVWQLRENEAPASGGNSYHEFFSQFVDHEARGLFFAELKQYLEPITFQSQEPGDPRAPWRPGPPNVRALRFDIQPIPHSSTRSVWDYLYERQSDKIINDARTVAVSTADADSNARWAWWENALSIAERLFNVAVMVVTPFVPFLGELMMAYTVYQMVSDTLEGAVDLAEGVWREGAEHIIGVASDVIQLGAMAVGFPVARTLYHKLSESVDNMIAVTLPNGETRLWLPDINPYDHQNLELPDTLTPDIRGLYWHDGAEVIRLDGRRLKVKRDPASGQYRLQHPTRPDAYAPRLEHNGRGAWRCEGEDPYAWDSGTLMRRFGHSTDGLSARQLEAVRRISAVDVETLQRIHADNAPPPLLLDDTLSRFKAFEDVGLMKRRIRSGAALDPSALWFNQMVTELPGWPPRCALKVYRESATGGEFLLYGNAEARAQDILSVSQAQVLDGKLPEAVAGFFKDARMKRLLGADIPAHRRVQALRDRLADMIDSRAEWIADYTYRARVQSRNPHARQLQRLYPELPAAVAERLIDEAPPTALKALATQRRLPLAFKVKARECAFEIRLARAYEGFFTERASTVDTERLTLNTLMQREPLKNVRIEIRDDDLDETLRCAAGPEDARYRRVLLRDGQGRYAGLGGDRSKLFEADTVFEAILQAMPEKARNGLGPGQGTALKARMADENVSPEKRRMAMLTAPLRPVAARETHWMLRASWFSRLFSSDPALKLKKGVRRLYPMMSEAERNAFIQSLPAGADPIEVVKRLQNQLQELEVLLDNWKARMANPLPDEPLIVPAELNAIVDRLMGCFRRESDVLGQRTVRFDDGYTLDLSTQWLGFDVARWWKKRPDIKAYLDQVTTLSLDNVRLSGRSAGMLKDFPRLRHLSVCNSELAQMPEAVYSMRELETLVLSDNRIALTNQDVERLKYLTGLRMLKLDRNPLVNTPDVSYMRHLKVLTLREASLAQWPAGLLSTSRPRGLFVDLVGNPNMSVPSVEPGSPEAWIIARTRFSVSKLAKEQRKQLFEYRDAVGIPRENYFSPLADDALRKWPLLSDSLLWKDDPSLANLREEAWHSLMDEPNHEGFFQIIDKLTESADFNTEGELKMQLTRRVWNLIDAIDLNAQLREELFKLVQEPETCADASSELFNRMGVRALVSQAYDYSTTPEEMERRLVTLARGASRLERVNMIAREDVLKRARQIAQDSNRPLAPHNEEVEIYLAYQTGLSRRLGLPWQTENMLHSRIAGVSREMLDAAYQTVLELENGDGLVNGMLELDFWENYLNDSYKDVFKLEDAHYDREHARIEEERNNQSLSDSGYRTEYELLAYNRMKQRRELTRSLLKKHNLLENGGASPP